MKKTNILLISLAASFANRGNIWYFGVRAGVDFNSVTPVGILGGQINTLEGCASICDDKGNLMFYTDGTTVWDSTHSEMQNGTGLLGSSTSTQSAIIIPKPGSTVEYYIFTADYPNYQDLPPPNAQADGTNYSVVDMTANGGLGAVTVKNQVLLDFATHPSGEKLSGVMHANGSDYWVIAHGWNDNRFYAWQVTPSGILPPVTTDIGTVHQDVGSGTKAEVIGYMKASPDGTKLALCIGREINRLEIFDFNDSTGAVSNTIATDYGSLAPPYGVEFSPNNEVLYVSVKDFMNDPVIYQYDLTAGDSASIIASERTVTTLPGRNPNALQRGPDDKIYVAMNGEAYLDAISNPDVYGAAVNYQQQAVDLLGEECKLGLPPIFPAFFDSLSISAGGTSPVCIDGCDGAASVTIMSGKSPYTFFWSTGDTTQTITGLCPGTYTVTVTDDESNSATAQAEVTNPPPSIIIDNETSTNAPNGTVTIEAHHAGDTSGLLGRYDFRASSTSLSSTQLLSAAFSDFSFTNCTQNTSGFPDDLRVEDLSTGAWDLTEYFGFTLTADIGATLNFTTSDYLYFTAFCSNPGTADLNVQYSIDAGAFATLATITDITGTETAYNMNFSTDIQTAEGGNIEFRFLARQMGAASDRMHIDSLQLYGTIENSLLYDIGSGQQDTGYFDGLAAGDYTVTITDADGCTRESNLIQVTPLPVELTSFTGYNDGEVNRLQWITASETNNDYFTLERSADGTTFEQIYTVKGAGNSIQEIRYTAVDISPFEGTTYYRLKQTDFNGKYSYSDVISLHNRNALIKEIYPVPAKERLIVVASSPNIVTLNCLITDLQGRVISSKEIMTNARKNQYTIDVSDLARGMYFLRVKTENDYWKGKFIKQ